jgi:phosphoglycolate phosphatase-like HAD superfamily hydrolase
MSSSSSSAGVVYLFDIDGTLLRAGGAGARAFDRVMVTLHAVERASEGTLFGGKTDPWIIDQIYRRHLGRAASDADVAAFIDCYLPLLEDELLRKPPRVLPAVVSTLDALADLALLGVATGNVERGADIKLRAAGLTGRFRFGGYGSDARDRAALVAIAIERARALAPDHTEVVVVGDTIHDIAAARACAATVCAVTTGSDPRDALLEADAVFDSMEELLPWHRARFA